MQQKPQVIDAYVSICMFFYHTFEFYVKIS